TPDQAELVATIADQILPATDTPGARAVGVHRFIDALLAESYPAAERARFVAGLADLGRAFQASTPDQQRALLERLDREAAPFFRSLKELTLVRSEEHTSELQLHLNLVCRLLPVKKN